jgi:hypothetical protein
MGLGSGDAGGTSGGQSGQGNNSSQGGGGGGVGGSCFIAGTLVWMADGSRKKIEDVEIGDKLVGRNSTHNKVLEFDHPKLGDRSLYSFGDSAPWVTAEHPFMTKGGWRSIDPAATAEENPELIVKRLVEHDHLLAGMQWVPIGDIVEHEADPDTQLYNFVLSGDHTYYADGFLVHNKAWDDITSSGSGGDGLTKSQIQAMIDEQGMGPARYNPWTDVINNMRDDTVNFANTVSTAQQAGADQAFGAAGQISQFYDPLTAQNAANAQGFQYLDPDQQASMMEVMNDPNLTPEQRQAALNDFQNVARGAGVGEIQGNAAQILADMTSRGMSVEDAYRAMGDEGYDRTYGRAMTDQQRQITQSNAAISQTYAGQNREMMRRGFNPAQIAQLATQNANQEALARVAGTNAAFGQTGNTMRAAEDVRSGLYNQGTTNNMNIRFGGEDTARTMTQGAEGVMREQFGTGAAAGATFGTQATNQALTTGGNLGAQAAGTQQGAANIGQTGALGVMNTLSQDYRTDNQEFADSGGGSSAMIGALAGGAMMAFSDRTLKENITQIGEFVKGIGVYVYNYIGDTAQHVGVMADEVASVFPTAVGIDRQGYQLVDYKALRGLTA